MIRKNIFKKVIQILFAVTLLLINSQPAMKTDQTIAQYNQSPVNNADTTIYVDDDNKNGPWNGTIDCPFQRISDAINHAKPHDHIYVFNGIYYEHLLINKPLTIKGESNQHAIIDGAFVSNTIRITGHNVTLTRFKIQNSGITTNDTAILLENKNNIIMENNIVQNNYGIIIKSMKNAILYNNFKYNTYHCYTINNNTIFFNYWDDYQSCDNNEDGIGDKPYYLLGNNNTDPSPLVHQYGAIKNQETQEIFFNIQSAIYASTTKPGQTILLQQGTFSEHIVFTKPLTLQGIKHTETIIDGRYNSTIIKINSNNCHIKNITIKNSGSKSTDIGIQISGANNTMTNCLITDNNIGIHLNGADNSYLTKNQILDNRWIGIYINNYTLSALIIDNIIQSNIYAGIGINTSSNNHIYHNDFIDNTHSAYDHGYNLWDNGYPTGGNYWQDYSGVDLNQDGIGDTKHKIKGGINEDRYPLIFPQYIYDPTPPTISIQKPSNGLYIRQIQFLKNVICNKTIIIGSITIKTTAQDSESGIACIDFYLDNEPELKHRTSKPPYEWTWIQRNIFIHTHTIEIVAYNKAGVFNTVTLTVKRYL